jgi:hypothetical protein
VEAQALMRIATSTWGWLAAAAAAVVLVHADPWQRAGDAPLFVSSRSAAVRVLPELPEGVPADLVVELAGPEGPRARIEPGPRGAVVLAVRELVGPADPEALDGLWASLRAATTLRAVAADTDAGLGERGRIALSYGDTRVEILLGRESPDGAGLYGSLADADGRPTGELWVVERELGDIVDQSAEAWAARRPLVLEPGEVARVAFADAEVVRGLDGMWRSTVGDATAIVQREAVEARLGRLVSARLDPWLAAPYARDETAPWVRLATHDGAELPLWLRGPCPGFPDRVVVDRGEGRAGCVDARIVEPWPLPGREGMGTAWVEPRLLPHHYDRVLSIEQVRPRPQLLRRHGGTWVIETDDGGSKSVLELRESEVFAWYSALFDARFDHATEARGDADAVELRIVTDSTESVRLRCGEADDDGVRACRRDDEPALAVRVAVDPAFVAETFADRELVDIEAGQARAIEITGRDVVRQSVHLDLGVWRLDAPLHPEGDAVLDDLALEDLLATITAARAQEWTATPADTPERVLRIERTSARGQGDDVELQLWPASADTCVVRVGQGRAAKVGEGTCRALRRDLLLADPLAHVLDDARTLALREGDREIRLRRDDGGRWVREDGSAPGEERSRFTAWSMLRTTALRPGEPRGTAAASLAVQPTVGEPYTMEVGDGWARVVGQPWFYLLALAPEDEESAGDELDDAPTRASPSQDDPDTE